MPPGRRWTNALARFTDRRSAEGARRDRRIGTFLTVAVATLIAVALSLTAPWKLVEARAFDYLSTLAPPPRPADGPVIVAIDEPSMAEIGLQWPWPRNLHARLITALREAGAKAIAIDIIFAEPSSSPADQALTKALGADVVLAGDETLVTAPHADQIVRVEPLQQFIDAGARVGIASISLDRDATLRRAPARDDGLASVLLDIAGVERKPAAAGGLLQVFGPARSYPTFSYYQAIEPGEFLPEGVFRGRAVVVGLSMQATPTVDAGGADAHATSYTMRTGQLTSGAEIQATIYDNLAHGLLILPASATAGIIAALLAALLAGALVWRGTGWRTALWSVAAAAALVAGCWLLLRFGRVFVPPVAPALALVLTAAIQGGRDYAAERRLRRGITRAFSQYLSPVLVERLASDPAKLRLGGERRTLSILFCDVRGFTTIAENMKDDPEALTRLVNRLLDPLSQVVLAAGGTIDKYMGDCIMAFWNAPLDDPDHAARAVGAALKMLDELEALNRELAEESAEGGNLPRLGIGIGINTGACVVGNMGSAMRFDYSAIGDAVNLASRLEGQTRNYEVPLLLGEDTAALVSSRWTTVELDRISVKGRTASAPISTVVSAADASDLALHNRLLGDFYDGTLRPDDPRLDDLARRLPELAGYYAGMWNRLEARRK